MAENEARLEEYELLVKLENSLTRRIAKMTERHGAIKEMRIAVGKEIKEETPMGTKIEVQEGGNG